MQFINETLKYIHSTSWKGSQLGLSRISKLFELLGNPQKGLKIIHIAGTNGKGSTAAMLASILLEAGYKTGLYTSPFIHKFNERIQINSLNITDEELVDLANKLRVFTDQMSDSPTEFELITAMAFLHFSQKQCDIVVLEVGMGGRLDATNVIDTPEIAVITSIGLDHTSELGDTVEKIAFEKTGIIKQNGVVISYPQTESVEKIIREKCKEQKARVSFVDSNDIKFTDQNLSGQRFEYKEINNLIIPLLGKHQLLNAAVVIKAINALQNRGWFITEEALRNGLKKTIWPCRFEVIMRNPVFIVDGAHNPQGVQAVVDTLSSLFPGRKITFLAGVLEDKNYQEMIEILAPHANRFITVTPNSSRALPAKDLALYIEKYQVRTIVCESIEYGVRASLNTAEKDDIICALGSLYIVGPIRDYLYSTLPNKRKSLRPGSIMSAESAPDCGCDCF